MNSAEASKSKGIPTICKWPKYLVVLNLVSFHFSFHLQLFIHEKNPSAINIKNLLTNLNLEIKFLKSLKSYIPSLLLFQGVVF